MILFVTPISLWAVTPTDTEALHQDHYWRVLLHYRPSGAGYTSLIDDPRFFLSPNGKTHPQAELAATLSAFLSDQPDGDVNPRCRFPARFAWLSHRLNIPPSENPVSCPEWDKLINAIQPRSAAMIFPAFFMNNPASMFGHTLIRIDGTHESKLLSYAANYAATADGKDFLYAFKGVFGFYKGYFSLFPYYDMVKKYSNSEQRDMWEYALDFSQEEAMQMVRHLWELKDIYSYYYYFDENCSFNLLYLLEAARPTLNLIDRIGPFTIPVDTVRVVVQSGVVSNLHYRPARATRIQHLSLQITPEAQTTALAVVNEGFTKDKLMGFEKEEQKTILDLSVETLQYQYAKQAITKEIYLKHFLGAAQARSQLGVGEDQPPVPTPYPPHLGHASSQLSIGVGVRTDHGNLFNEIGYRAAYHSLDDPDKGYLKGSQIVFGDIKLRYDSMDGIRLQHFDLIDILSLSPRDQLFKPISFKVQTGFTRKSFPNNINKLVYQLNPGVGLSFPIGRLGFTYALAEANLNIGNGPQWSHHYRLGFGLETGLLTDITPYWKSQIMVEVLFYELEERFQEKRFSTAQTFSINQSNSMRLSFSKEKSYFKRPAETKIAWNYYF